MVRRRRSKEDSGKTPKTDVQCRNRIDTVKKKYKQEKARISYGGGGGGRSSWVFYDKLDRLIGSTAKIASLIPVGVPMRKSSSLYNHQQDSEFEVAMSDDSGDSLPPLPLSKRMKTEEKGKQGGGGNTWRELSSVIVRFSEGYEEIENEKMRQVVEMEKERLKMLREMELRRMQFFEKIQVELLSQLKQQGR